MSRNLLAKLTLPELLDDILEGYTFITVTSGLKCHRRTFDRELVRRAVALGTCVEGLVILRATEKREASPEVSIRKRRMWRRAVAKLPTGQKLVLETVMPELASLSTCNTSLKTLVRKHGLEEKTLNRAMKSMFCELGLVVEEWRVSTYRHALVGWYVEAGLNLPAAESS